MPGPITAVSIYMVVWWVVLFMVLPHGVQSHAEAGIDLKDGGDPGAPVDPKLKRKFITTTWVSAIVFAVLWAFLWLSLKYGWFAVPSIAQEY